MSLIHPKKFFDLLPINCSWNEFWGLYIRIYNDNHLNNDDLDDNDLNGFLTIGSFYLAIIFFDNMNLMF